MANAIFEIRRSDGLLLCDLNSLGGVWGGAISAAINAGETKTFPRGRGLTMWMTYVCLGAHDVQTGLTADGDPYVTLIPKANLSTAGLTTSIIQVFFR